MSKSKKQPEAFQSIDPAALQNVSGGAARAAASSDADAGVTDALNGILDSIKSLSQNRNQGMDPTMFMMMAMMMGHRQQPQVVVAPSNTVGGYAGYTIDGQFDPFK